MIPTYSNPRSESDNRMQVEVTTSFGMVELYKVVERDENNAVVSEAMHLTYKGAVARYAYYAEVLKRIEAARKPATATETPQISTETAETVNVPPRAKQRRKRHICSLTISSTLLINSATLKRLTGRMPRRCP